MDKFCKDKKSKMFELLAAVKLSEIRHLKVHDTKEPVLTLELFQDDGFKGFIKLLFAGDMERQMFVARMWDLKKKNINANAPIEMEAQKGARRADDESYGSEDSGPDSEDETCEMTIYF